MEQGEIFIFHRNKRFLNARKRLKLNDRTKLTNFEIIQAAHQKEFFTHRTINI